MIGIDDMSMKCFLEEYLDWYAMFSFVFMLDELDHVVRYVL